MTGILYCIKDTHISNSYVTRPRKPEWLDFVIEKREGREESEESEESEELKGIKVYVHESLIDWACKIFPREDYIETIPKTKEAKELLDEEDCIVILPKTIWGYKTNKKTKNIHSYIEKKKKRGQSNLVDFL